MSNYVNNYELARRLRDRSESIPNGQGERYINIARKIEKHLGDFHQAFITNKNNLGNGRSCFHPVELAIVEEFLGSDDDESPQRHFLW